MLSAFYVCSLYSRSLQARCYYGSKQNPDQTDFCLGSSLIFAHTVCNIERADNISCDWHCITEQSHDLAHAYGQKSLMIAQELEVRSLNHPYSLKTKSSQCHYVVMTRSETKFQAPLNRRYQEVLAKTEHLTIKTMSTGHARHG